MAASVMSPWRCGLLKAAHFTEPAARFQTRALPLSIETSHSAQIPVDDCALWPIIQRTMRGDDQWCWQLPPGLRLRRDGSIVVGCHDIAYSEIEPNMQSSA